MRPASTNRSSSSVDAVVSPEALAAKDEDRHAEDLVGVRLLDARLERRGAFAAAVGAIVGAEPPISLDQRRDLLG